MTMNDEELRALMAEVQGELEGVLKSEKEKLAKAHPGEEDSSEVPADESATASDGDADDKGSAPPASDEGSASASAPPPGDEASASAPPADAPPADSPPADDAGAGDPMAGAGVVDPEAIKAELAQMPPEHVKALYLAAKEVLFAQMGAAGDAGGSAPPAPDASAPSAPPAPEGPPALKGEMKANPANGGQTKVAKAESEKDAEIEALKKKVADFEGITTGLITVVEKAISVPARKAVVSVADLQKSGADAKQLPKPEIAARLDRAARTKLSKSDRDLINQFTVGAISVEKIQHLLDVK